MARYQIAEHPFDTLNQKQVERLHSAIMQELATVGVVVESAEARDILHSAGGTVHSETCRVTLPERCV